MKILLYFLAIIIRYGKKLNIEFKNNEKLLLILNLIFLFFEFFHFYFYNNLKSFFLQIYKLFRLYCYYKMLSKFFHFKLKKIFKNPRKYEILFFININEYGFFFKINFNS